MSIGYLLMSSPLFADMYDKEVEKVAKHCEVLNFNRGDVICPIGEPETYLYILLNGEVQVRVPDESEPIVVQHLRKDDVFGEMVLLEEKIRTTEAVAHCDEVAVLAMNYDAMTTLFHKESKIFSLLMLNASRLLAKRLTTANESIIRISLMARKVERIAEELG